MNFFECIRCCKKGREDMFPVDRLKPVYLDFDALTTCAATFRPDEVNSTRRVRLAPPPSVQRYSSSSGLSCYKAAWLGGGVIAAGTAARCGTGLPPPAPGGSARAKQLDAGTAPGTVPSLEDEVGASLVECRLRDTVRGVLHCNLAGGATADQRCLLPLKVDVVFLLTRVLEDLQPCGANPGVHVAPLSRVRRVLRSGGLLALAGITSPALGFKEALEDALITAGYGNLAWSTTDFERPACPSTRSFLLLSNVIWPEDEQ
ncbi:uncharacterized protein [Dermacentor albipictus]|uniref:uncharacterized protein isoform X2 n=1 Tax=Dermacentor albipictus TaxID=60249 RepID=UPI0031FC4114